jgi:hypothetical protein
LEGFQLAELEVRFVVEDVIILLSLIALRFLSCLQFVIAVFFEYA